MRVHSTKIKKLFGIGLPLILSMLLMVEQGAGDEGITDAIAVVYVGKKKEQYRQRTEKLRGMLRALGGSLSSSAKKLELPELTRIEVTVSRTAAIEMPVLNGRDFIARVGVALKRDSKSGRRLGRSFLAADRLTATAFGLSQYVYLNVTGRIARVEGKKVAQNYTVWESKKYGNSRKIDRGSRSVKYDMLTFEDADLRGLLQQGKGNADVIGIALDGRNLVYDPAVGGLRPRDAGAVSPPGYITWERPVEERIVPFQPPGYPKKYVTYDKLYDLDRSKFIRLTNSHTVKRAKLSNKDMADFPRAAIKIVDALIEPTGQKDFFFEEDRFLSKEPGTYTSFKYKAILDTDKWSKNVSIRRDSFGVDTEGDGPFLITRFGEGRISIRRLGNRTGSTKITAYLVSDGGHKEYPRSFTVTANRIEGIILDAPLVQPPGSGPLSGYSAIRALAAGKEYTVSMVVQGPADMGRYHAEWSVAPLLAGGKTPIVFDPQKSAFQQDGDRWVASASMRVPDTAADTTSPGRSRQMDGWITARITSPEGDLASTGIAVAVSSPTITGVALSGAYGNGAEGDAHSGPLNLFLGSVTGLHLYAQVLFSLERGEEVKSVKLPVRWIRVQQDRGMMLQRVGDVLMPAGNTSGTAMIRAVIRRNEAEAAMVSVDYSDGKDFIESEALEVAINRPFLVIASDRSFFRLVIDGPADMNGYLARWKLYSHGKNVTGMDEFNRVDGRWMSSYSTWVEDTTLISVEILDKKKRVAARLNGDGRSVSVISPSITLKAVGGVFVQGMAQKITADITNLPAGLAPRTVLKWYFIGVVPEIYGTSVVTRLEAAGDGYRSGIVVNYPEDPSTAGKKPGIRVELILLEDPAVKGVK